MRDLKEVRATSASQQETLKQKESILTRVEELAQEIAGNEHIPHVCLRLLMETAGEVKAVASLVGSLDVKMAQEGFHAEKIVESVERLESLFSSTFSQFERIEHQNVL
eukprot:643561-Hanusia_phi.AAC.1